MQELIVGIVFLVAVAYLGKQFWGSFTTKDQSGCAKGCDGCGTINVDEIERQIEKQS